MLINVNSSNAANVLQNIVRLPMLNESKVNQGVEFIFDAAGLTLSRSKALAILVQKAYGARCVGAYPSGNKFVVILRTNLSAVAG